MATSQKRPELNGAAQRPRGRVLRIGVLLGGKIVEEKLVRERIPVTIGQSMKNTFSIPIEGLPLEFTLFALDDNRYSLRFLNRMDGRLSDGGQVNTLDQLKAKGAQNHGDYWQAPLGESSRGKLSLGDLTILFQFVPEPPRQPKPMLPASVRGTFADRFDPRLMVILGISILFHFSWVIAALVADPERPESIADRAYDMVFKQDTYNVDVTQPDAAKPTADKGETAVKKPDAPKVADKKPPTAKPAANPDAGRKPDDQVAMQETATKFADLLTSDGPNGTTVGEMDKRRPGADLKQQIADVKDSGGTVAVGDTSGRGSRNNGGPRVGTGGGPNLNGPTGPTSADGGKVAEKGPAGRISVADKQTFDDSSLTPDVVLAKIQSAYMAGLKRCYKDYLVKKDASARGKVTLTFGVNATGRATGGAAHGFAGEVDACIGGQMASWRFPVPKDKDGEATDANFSITLQLVPD